MQEERTLEDNIRDREELEREFWKRSEELAEEFERLIES